MKYCTLLFSAMMIFSFISVKAQQNRVILADDILIKQKFAENPGLINAYNDYEKGLRYYIESSNLQAISKTDTLINGKRVIPVVFHIIHNYGIENISDAQVLDAIQKINIDYAKMNADTADTYPLFKSRAAALNIELRLANKDSVGNCTSGIIHHYDPGTDFAYFSTMKTYHWPTTKYMNIFVVNFIYPEGMALPDGAFIGGMSPFPPSNTLSQALTGGDVDIDGVLIRHDCIGSIGTAESMGGMGVNALNRTFTHETGHYFNLYHPFQVTYGALLGYDGCGPALLGCGDEVADTPPIAAASQNTSLSCFTPGSRNTCTESNDEPDMIENYMDYQWGYCSNLFTNGQKTRVDAVLNGERRNLWSIENLTATGVLDTTNVPECAPLADFNTTSKTICAGTTINFTDFSYNATPTEWLWEFEGGTPATSTSQNASVTYNTPGTYQVKLTVTNAQGNNSLTKTNYITVYSSQAISQAPIYEGFESGLIGDWGYVNENGNTWEWYTPQAFEGSRCLKLNNFSGNAGNSIDAIITPGYDLTTLNTNKVLRLKFSYAYCGKIIPATIAAPADTAWDKVYIYTSVDCGKTWTLKWSKSGTNMESTNPVSTAFTPSDTSQWRTDSVNIHSYVTSGATNLRIKLEFIANGGNNFYFDYLIMDNHTLSAEEFFSEVLEMKVFPNPAGEVSNISLNLPGKDDLNITLTDVLGNKIMTIADGVYNEGQNTFQIPAGNMSKGVYFISTVYGEYSKTTKFVVD